MFFDASSDPIMLWLYAERYLLGGTRTYSPFALINEMDPVWQPDSDVCSLKLPCFWIDTSKHAKFICKSPRMSPSIKEFYSPEHSKFLLPIHPATIPLLPSDVLCQIKELIPGPKLDVSPTSSTRTLYVHGANGSDKCPQHFLKLHFPGRISRFFRSMTHEDVIHQLWASEQIQKAKIPHLPDLGGGYALSNQDLSIGFLIRSTLPENALNGLFFTVPGYSLFGIDKNSPADPPLLEQLHRHFGETSKDFLLNRIIIPTVVLWVKTVSTVGIIPELHGQNVLFSFSRCGSVSSISFRDSDLFVDSRIRKQLGIKAFPTKFVVPYYNCNVTSEQVLSLCYDGFLIHHFLAKIAACAKDWFGIPASVFRDAAISAFHTAGGGALPISELVFYFDDQLHPEEQFILIEKPSFDVWR